MPRRVPAPQRPFRPRKWRRGADADNLWTDAGRDLRAALDARGQGAEARPAGREGRGPQADPDPAVSLLPGPNRRRDDRGGDPAGGLRGECQESPVAAASARRREPSLTIRTTT